MSRYIDADAIEDKAKQYSLGYYEEDEWAVPFKEITSAPSIDIVRCQDCRHRYMDADLQVWTCTYGLMIKPNGFCNYGERKESE